ncbi:hypothetical protein V7S43_010459 [Phytophthora oleae]|uniref:RxLR effector protein n=1 Tax=Phytophthora oleae TaxID=2107226 RepID=A0ABD3FCQ2_9STRA
MRPSFVLLVAVVALLIRIGAASGSTTKLRAAQNLLRSTETAETEHIGRVLRDDATSDPAIDPDSEERGIADLAKLLGTKSKTLFDNNALATIVRLKSQFSSVDDAMQAFLARNINPDMVYKWLKLYKPNNQVIKKTGDAAPEYLLWLRYAKDYKVAHPKWVTKLKPGA